MNPYVSWAILLLTAGGLGYYYKNGTAPKARPAFMKPTAEKQDNAPPASKKAKQRNKTRKAQQENGSNSNGHAKEGISNAPGPKKEVKTQTTTNTNTTTAAEAAEEPASARNGGMDDNYEFAKQFAKVKSGTPLTGKAAPAKPKAARSGKPSTSNTTTPATTNGNHDSTATSSTTGADADDDMSPINSPVVKPAGDVADMLEEPAAAPSVLRLTEFLDDATNKKNNSNKQNGFKSVETKKQRQARRKREEKNELVKQAEKSRRAMVENQMHAAREFERQQAKPKSPPANAWAAPVQAATPAPTNGTNGGLTNGVNGTGNMPLLDTFEQPQDTPKRAVDEQTPWANDLPSEEEQMRMLHTLSSENEWTTVSNRKKEKRSKTESVSEASSSEPHASIVETSW